MKSRNIYTSLSIAALLISITSHICHPSQYLSSVLAASLIFITPFIFGGACISLIKYIGGRFGFCNKRKEPRIFNLTEFLFFSFLIGILFLNLFLALGPTLPRWNFVVASYVLLVVVVLINLAIPFEFELNVNKEFARDIIMLLGIALLPSVLVLPKLYGALEFPLSLGYPYIYLFTAKNLLFNNALYFNSYAYLLQLHGLLGITLSLTSANPFAVVASVPLYSVPIFTGSIYAFSRSFGTSRIASILLSSMSLFIIHPAMGTLLYFSQRTFLLLMAPAFLIYVTKLMHRLQRKIILHNTVVPILIMAIYAVLDPRYRIFFLLISLAIVSCLFSFKGSMFAYFDFLVTFSFTSIHSLEALPYIIFRGINCWRAGDFAFLSRIGKWLKNIILVLISVVVFAPLFQFWSVLDTISIDFLKLNISKNIFEPYPFHDSFKAWHSWIIYAFYDWNYNVVLALFLMYTLFACKISRSLFLLLPSLLLASILVIRTGEVFRYLDALNMFYLGALITATSFIEKLGKVKLRKRMFYISVRIYSHTKKIPSSSIFFSALLVILAISNVYTGLQRTSDYFYVNTAIRSLMNRDDLALIDFFNTMYPSYRKYPLLPDKPFNQQPLEYHGPLVISDPFTMLMLYYSTGSEVYMDERLFITETGYSNQTVIKLKMLKEGILRTDLGGFLQSVGEYLKKSPFNFSATLLVITPRTILWLTSSDEIFITQHYDSDSEFIHDQMNALIAKFLANGRFELVQEINQGTFIIKFEV